MGYGLGILASKQRHFVANSNSNGCGKMQNQEKASFRGWSPLWAGRYVGAEAPTSWRKRLFPQPAKDLWIGRVTHCWVSVVCAGVTLLSRT